VADELDALLSEARADDNILGVVVFGSRGKGAFVRDESDWDVFVIVREHRGERPFVHGARLETVELTLDELRNQPDWNRYALAWLEPQLDKTGEVAKALRDGVRVDPATAGEPLDAYMNSTYRSLKNTELGLELAALLDAQDAVRWYLDFVFVVHDRLRPFNKWLAWELEHHPLPSDVPLARLERIARTGDLEEQAALFRDAETAARTRARRGRRQLGARPGAAARLVAVAARASPP
jgi:predicted nucleotidyltransferase